MMWPTTWTPVICVALWAAVTVFGVLGIALLSVDATLGGVLVVTALILGAPASVASSRMDELRDH